MPQWVLDLLFLPPEGSTSAAGIDALHVFVISVTMASSLGIFLLAGYFVLRYPLRQEGQLTANVRASAAIEATIIGGILTLFLTWWVIGYRQFVAMVTPPGDAMTVYVSAKQWMWKFTYPDGRSSNDVLTVPKGRAVKLVMISRDVIHSFYVPAFRMKQDVLPGRYSTFWFESQTAGRYPIFCAEYCGTSHSMMLGTVAVLDEHDYADWLTNPVRDASGETDLVTTGARVARERACLSCHSVTGQRTVGPSWAALYGSKVPLENGQTVVADEAYLTKSMMEPNADVVASYKPVMPTYVGILPGAEAAAIVEYIKSLRDTWPQSGVVLPELQIDSRSLSDAGTVDGGVMLIPRLP